MLLKDSLAQQFLGAGFMTRLKGEIVLSVGKESYSRHDLVTRLHTGNFRAARILHEYCHTNKIKSLEHLYETTSPYELGGTQGFGETTLYVLLELFEKAGKDVRQWYRLPDPEDSKKWIEGDVTFNTVKKNALAVAVDRFKASKKREAKGIRRSRATAPRTTTGNARPDTAAARI